MARSSSPTLDRRYLELLSRQFPTSQAAFTEIINLEAILNLPKGTEHFVSDVHGEYEAFCHILNNCSGVIRERIGKLFRYELTADEQAELCTLIYYPEAKLRRMRREGTSNDEWYRITLMRLMRLARHLSYSYTRSKVRTAIPTEYSYIIDELLHSSRDEHVTRQNYHRRIIDAIIDTGSAEDFICSVADLIKTLAVDRLHVVGDLYDRGPHGDRIIDELMRYHSLDIQWGNHDAQWMGAAAGSEVCIASIVRTCVHYNTLEILENAYGISLRELYLFAERTYKSGEKLSDVDKAITIIMFKLEGQIIMRHPEWGMMGRLLLDKIDKENGTVTIDGTPYKLRTNDFPTIDPFDPYALSDGERKVMSGIIDSVQASERLKAHAGFLFEYGSIYRIHNNNLLFHGCVPMDPDGSFHSVQVGVRSYAGKDYLDLIDRIARRAWHTGDRNSLDWMWYMWCGRNSPLCGRVIKTFERTFVEDESTWKEDEDPYYALTKSPEACDMIMADFGLTGPHCHIINGHTPIKTIKGESPIKAGGRLIVIDGGFCRAYHKRTGIAGYTLISDPNGMRIKAHRPFTSIEDALDSNADITSDDDKFEFEDTPLEIKDTDTGETIRGQIQDLRELLEAYRSGDIPERGGR